MSFQSFFLQAKSAPLYWTMCLLFYLFTFYLCSVTESSFSSMMLLVGDSSTITWICFEPRLWGQKNDQVYKSHIASLLSQESYCVLQPPMLSTPHACASDRLEMKLIRLWVSFLTHSAAAHPFSRPQSSRMKQALCKRCILWLCQQWVYFYTHFCHSCFPEIQGKYQKSKHSYDCRVCNILLGAEWTSSTQTQTSQSCWVTMQGWF